jgi:hypothetical protein
MTIFEFKRKTWTNQIAPHRYRPSAPVAIGTDRPGRPVLLQATSSSSGDTDQGRGATDMRSVSSDPHWNQPKHVAP